MGTRPAQIRYLTEGKALGAAIHKGFAVTWNWLLAWVNFFKGGSGCKIVNAASGHPRLDVLIEGGDGVDVKCAGDGQPYVISIADGGEGDGDGDGGETIDIEADPDRFVSVDDMEIYASVRQDEESGKTLVGLTTVSPEDEDKDEDTYCNDISDDDDGNGIATEFDAGGGGPSGGGGDPDNFISRWPCKKNDDDAGGQL